MQKHWLRLTLVYTGFELVRCLGSELPMLFRGQPIFSWIRHPQSVWLIASGFFIFLLYPLLAFTLFERFFQRSRRRTILYFGVAVVAVIALRYCVQELLFPAAFGFRNYYKDVPLLYYFVDNLYFAVLYSAFGVIYYLLQNEHRRQLEHGQLALQNKHAQLSFLQSQVNPHFIFNSLNNIYALVYHKSSKALPALAHLSELLRYTLYEGSDRVALQKEVDYIDKYLALQALRFEQEPLIDRQVTGTPAEVQVAPLLLIPFVENAFKHGDFRGAGPHLSVYIDAAPHTLYFAVHNSIGHHQKDSSGGIGLENVRRRLALLYPGKHSLVINNDGQQYTAELTLQHD